MKNNKISIYFFLSITMLFLTSCESFFNQVIEVEIPEHTPLLAVTANFNAKDSMLVAFVTKSRSTDDNTPYNTVLITQDTFFYDPEDSTQFYAYDNRRGEFDSLKNVVVKLLKNNQELYTLTREEIGFYSVRNIPPLLNDGSTYTLRVEADGLESISADQIIPSEPIIESVNYDQDGITDTNGERRDKITINFKDNASDKNYYVFKGKYYTKYDDGYYVSTFTFDSYDPRFDAITNTLSDASFNGQSYSFVAFPYLFAENTTGNYMIITVESINQETFLYESSLRLNQENDGNPFREPIIVKGNFSNGFGIFSIKSEASYRIDF